MELRGLGNSRATLDCETGQNTLIYTIVLSTRPPQSCCLSPLLYSVFTQDRVAKYDNNSIITFADDITVIELIRDNDEKAYRMEVEELTS